MKIFSKIKKITNVLNFKIIKYIFIIILILLSSLSFFILLILHWELFISRNNIFNFSLVGLDNYLSYLYKYSKIFGANIAVLTVYMIIHNSEENRKKDLYNDWLRKLDLNCKIINKEDEGEAMTDYYKNYSLKYFTILNNYNFRIKNKKQLEIILDHFIGTKESNTLVNHFEQSNRRYIEVKGCYETDKLSYSLPSFRSIFLSFFDDYYDDVSKDLDEIYIKMLDKSRITDQDQYRTASNNASIKTIFESNK